MVRPREQVDRRRLLDDLAGVHHDDARAVLRHNAEIVRDEEDGRAQAAREIGEQLEDLRLDGDVERGRRLVGDDERGVHDERHRDDDALAHAAGELMRIFPRALLGRGDADEREHLDRLGPRVALGRPRVDARDLADLVADGEHRVQRRHRLLEHHRDAIASHVLHLALRQTEQVASLEAHDAARLDAPGRAHEAQDGERGDALAASRLPDDADRLAHADGERHAVHGAGDAVVRIEVGMEVLDLEQGRRHASEAKSASVLPRGSCRGSNASRKASASALHANTVTRMASPGNSVTHHSSVTCCAPS